MKTFKTLRNNLEESALVTNNTDALNYLLHNIKTFVQSSDYSVNAFNKIGSTIGLKFDNTNQRKGYLYIDKGKVKVR